MLCDGHTIWGNFGVGSVYMLLLKKELQDHPSHPENCFPCQIWLNNWVTASKIHQDKASLRPRPRRAPTGKQQVEIAKIQEFEPWFRLTLSLMAPRARFLRPLRLA
jgi:hypothetical protein